MLFLSATTTTRKLDTMYIQINVGRNYTTSTGTQDTHDLFTWDVFTQTVQRDLNNAVSRYLSDYPGVYSAPAEIHLGTGSWADQPEESAHISLFCGAIDTLSFQDSRAYRELVGALETRAIEYGQDAIALLLTESTLIWNPSVAPEPIDQI